MRLGQLRHGTDGQTDRRIAVSLNAPHGGGHNKISGQRILTKGRIARGGLPRTLVGSSGGGGSLASPSPYPKPHLDRLVPFL